jgi:hypothetical protein
MVTHGSVNSIEMPDPTWVTQFMEYKLITFIYKLLIHDRVLRKSDDEFHDIVLATNGDGYDALYNFLHFSHPLLSEHKVLMVILKQVIVDSFTALSGAKMAVGATLLQI